MLTFGFFDGTLEELRGGQKAGGYEERRKAADELVESVGTDGIFEVVDERSRGLTSPHKPESRAAGDALGLTGHRGRVLL